MIPGVPLVLGRQTAEPFSTFRCVMVWNVAPAPHGGLVHECDQNQLFWPYVGFSCQPEVGCVQSEPLRYRRGRTPISFTGRPH